MVRMRALVSVLAVLVLAAVLGACGGDSDESEFDRQFIDMMVPHHEGAIEMARIAEQRAEKAEIKQMAASVISAQQAEIQQMKAWRREWYGSGETPSMSRMPMVPGMADSGMAGMDHGDSTTDMATMDMAADVQRLRDAGAPFDRAFIDMMIAHHETAIQAAEAARTRAERQEIKDLASKIAADQQREVEQLRQWRRSWYGVAAR